MVEDGATVSAELVKAFVTPRKWLRVDSRGRATGLKNGRVNIEVAGCLNAMVDKFAWFLLPVLPKITTIIAKAWGGENWALI